MAYREIATYRLNYKTATGHLQELSINILVIYRTPSQEPSLYTYQAIVMKIFETVSRTIALINLFSEKPS